MPYVIGVDIGSGFTTASVLHDGETVPRPVRLGSDDDSVPSVLRLGERGEVTVGGTAVRRGDEDAGHLVTDFLRRVGDPVPVRVGGMWVAPEDLQAVLVRWVVDHAEDHEGEPPALVAVNHPADWGPYRIDLLTTALAGVGLSGSVLVADDAAVADAVTTRSENPDAARAAVAASQVRVTRLEGEQECESQNAPVDVGAATASAGRAHFSRPSVEPVIAGSGFLAWSASLNTGPRKVMASLGIAGAMVLAGAAAPIAFESVVLTADTVSAGARSLFGTLQTGDAPDAPTAQFIAAQPGASDPGVEAPAPGQKNEKTKPAPDAPVDAKKSPAAPGAPAATAPQPATAPQAAAAPAQSAPAQNDAPVPVSPVPADPAPVDPAPADPAPVDPAPVDPAPVDPVPVDPAPVDPAPVEPAPVDPAPVDPAPDSPAEPITTLDATVTPVDTSGETEPAGDGA